MQSYLIKSLKTGQRKSWKRQKNVLWQDYFVKGKSTPEKRILCDKELLFPNSKAILSIKY